MPLARPSYLPMTQISTDQEDTITEQGWRLLPSLYAEKMSDGDWLRYRWVDFILEYVRKRVAKGGARIIINAPPRHGKSEAISHWLPAWYLDMYPDRRVILGSYGSRFATKWGRKVRDHFLTNKQARTKISKEHASAADWETEEGGGMICAGVGKGITGEGGDLMIIDDPHKDWEEALSITFRRRAIDWFDSVFYTRKEPNASIVVIQTRWHERDLSGYLINEHADDWEVINLPALAEEDDMLGRQPGEALCPERFSAEVLHQIKAAISTYKFAGLYQQRPAPLEGGMVKRKWFQRYKELPEDFDEQIQVWDFTFKETVSGSYVVGELWGRKGANFFLVDQIRDRLDFPGMLMAITRFSNRWPDVVEKIVEEAADGYAIIDTLKDQIPGIIGVRPKGSKVARLVAVSGLLEAGNVWVPEQSVADWADDFIEEVVTFPNAANDDQVDAMTMALSRLSKRTQNFNITLGTGGARPSPWDFNG